MKSREREFYSHRRKESLTGVSPSVLGHSPAGVGSPDDHIDHQGVEIPQNDSMWQLTSDVNHNTTLREEFYYEQVLGCNIRITPPLFNQNVLKINLFQL